MKKIEKIILKKLYKPPKNSRKGDNGILLIIAGSEKYHGAPWYAIETASKIVDLVYFHSSVITMRLMEEIKKKSPSFITLNKGELSMGIKKSDCILVGPGWGKGDKKLLKNLLKKYKNKRFVLDADALKLLDKKLLGKNVLITPHAGEFKKLFKIKATSENVKKMAKKFSCIILLKSQKDIICSPKTCFYNITGNQGMTKGGTGDVLAGLIAALVCKNELLLAGQAGTLINGLAGDKLYKKYRFFYNARDLIEKIGRII